MASSGPFQSKLFCDSVILSGFSYISCSQRQFDFLIPAWPLEVFKALLESQVCLLGTSSARLRPHLAGLDYRNCIAKVGQYFCLIASFAISQMKPDHRLQPGISGG